MTDDFTGMDLGDDVDTLNDHEYFGRVLGGITHALAASPREEELLRRFRNHEIGFRFSAIGVVTEDLTPPTEN